MEVLVIGGNGNIGAAVVAQLLAKGHRVTCFNRGLSGPCHPDAEVMVGNRMDREKFEQAIQNRHFDAALDLFCFGKADALSSIRAFEGIGHVIQCSTIATYGRHFDWLPATEDHPLRPDGDYGRNKKEADDAFLAAYTRLGFPVTIVKPAVTYGPRFGLIRQIGSDLQWLARIRAGLPILISGDGIALHQFMHVDDLAVAIVALLGQKECHGKIINTVQPQPTSWETYHRTAMDVLGRDVPMVGAPAREIFAASQAAGQRVNDIWSHNSFFSTERLVRLTGFAPTIALKEGLSQVIEALLREGRMPEADRNGWESQMIAQISTLSNGRLSTGGATSLATERVKGPKSPQGAGREKLIEDLLTPNYDAPQESRIVRLVKEGIDGLPYNAVLFGDLYWALHWEEREFDIQRILAGKAQRTILVGASIEELQYGLKLILSRNDPGPAEPILVSEGLNGLEYNAISFKGLTWALHWSEGNFAIDQIATGKTAHPVVVAFTLEEVSRGLAIANDSAEQRLHAEGNGIQMKQVRHNLLLACTETPLDKVLGSKHSPEGTGHAESNGASSAVGLLDRLLRSYDPEKGGKDVTLDTEIFSAVSHNVYLLRIADLVDAPAKLQSTPAYKNARLPMENLFEEGNGDPIMIISPAPSRTCNYRCTYCYHHDFGFNRNTEATESWSKAILTAVSRIPRPIRLSAGAMGEPLVNPKWRETAVKILERENVLSLAFVSNLSQRLDTFFDRVDTNRIGVMASLHPSEFKKPDEDFADFLRKLEYLKNAGVVLVVNYVLTPEQLISFKEYRASITALGIPMTSNVLRGPYKGKVYPEAFTEKEMEIVRTCYDENSYIFDSQSHHRNPYGIECISGRRAFYLEFDGILFNCHFARQRLGSIYDDKLMIRSKNGFCTAQKCESQTTIGWQADVQSRFQVQRTLHHYIRM